MTTTIDVSAEFGGRAAARAVLPHFNALKAALHARSFDGFPFNELAFILRVDGEVNAYGQSGAGNVQIDKNGGYVSVDLGITRDDLVRLADAELSALIQRSIMSSVDLLKRVGDSRLEEADWDAVRVALKGFCAAYQSAFADGDRSPIPGHS